MLRIFEVMLLLLTFHEKNPNNLQVKTILNRFITFIYLQISNSSLKFCRTQLNLSKKSLKFLKNEVNSDFSRYKLSFGRVKTTIFQKVVIKILK